MDLTPETISCLPEAKRDGSEIIGCLPAAERDGSEHSWAPCPLSPLSPVIR